MQFYIYIVAFFTLFLHGLITSLAVTNILTDQTALLEFKTNYITSDPHSKLASNWSVSDSVCNWVGVTCGIRHKRVVALNLTNMALEGTLAPHLGNLSFLASLDISRNNFHGYPPKELSHLHRLRTLNLRTNGFNGEFPTWITNTSTLQYMVLSENDFSGEIPIAIGNLFKLRVLSLYSNMFSGPIPHSVGNLTALINVNLLFNNLNGNFASAWLLDSVLVGLIIDFYLISNQPEFSHYINIVSTVVPRDSSTENRRKLNVTCEL